MKILLINLNKKNLNKSKKIAYMNIKLTPMQWKQKNW